MISETTIHDVETIKISTMNSGIMLTAKDKYGNEHEVTLHHKENSDIKIKFE